MIITLIIGTINLFGQSDTLSSNSTSTTKDQWTILISGLALVISLIALIISIVQKNKETERTIRKNLSDTLESMSKITLEFAKLKQNNDSYNSPGVVELRRIYNTQRRVLIAHADYLATNYDKLVTDIDCNVLAGAFSASGDSQKANYYWEKTVGKSPSNPIRHMNLRGYARFLFYQGKFQLGRSKYEEALKLELPDTDTYRRELTDTYVMWAKVEKEFNNESEMQRIMALAKSYCARIGHAEMRKEMEQRIRTFEPTES